MKGPRHSKHGNRYNFERINAQQVEEISMQTFYSPRTLTLLVVTMATTYYVVMHRNEDIPEKNLEAGLYLMIVYFFIVSALVFPNGPFTRPHPVLWRLIFGISVFYLLCLSFAACLTYDQLKSVLYWMDPDVKHAKREIDTVEVYAVNCSSVSVDRIYSMLDIFAFGHFLGWVFKALALRSYVMCWSISILWEVTELVFLDIFPNFHECWWDQVIADICVCNALGIYVGMKVCKYLELRKYRWESIKNIHSTTGKLTRVVMQFTPMQWTSTTWLGPGSGTRRILGVFAVLFGFLVTELNTFFFKHIFRFPATHPFCWARLVTIVVVAAPTCRQGYVYFTDVTCNRLGTQAWVFLAMVGMESLISIKHGYAEFTQSQIEKIIAWIILTMLMTLLALYGLVHLRKNRLKQEKQSGRNAYDSPDDSSWERTDKSD